MSWPSLGVVVPVYNEAETIETSLRELRTAGDAYRGGAVLIAVDDGSRDGSREILARLADELADLDVQQHDVNRGYGEALRTGANRARALGLEYVAFIDSDLTNPPTDLLKIGPLAAAGHPYIKASRFAPGGDMDEVPLNRRLVSRAGNAVARTLFRTPVRDVTNGFRAVRTDLFCSMPLHEDGFAVIVEEFALVQRAGITPVEFPTSLGSRGPGQRPSAFAAYSPRLIASYLRYPVRAFARGARAGRRRGT